MGLPLASPAPLDDTPELIMALTSLQYDAPIRRLARRESLDYELFEQATALHEEGRPFESLTKVLAHLFPGQTLPDLAKEAFSFTQGSSRVTLRLDGDHVLISVPLVRLSTTGNAVAALRHVLTQISSTGQIFQPRLRGDDIHLEFRDRLARLHPAKVVEVLKRMPVKADANDDFLIAQFGALPLERAPIADLDDAELSRAEDIWRRHWSDVEELVKECQRKRSLFFLNAATAYAYHRICGVLPLGGFLLYRLNESAETFLPSDEDPTKRETSLAKWAREMKAVPREELKKSLGHAEYAISPLTDGEPSALTNVIGENDRMETIQQLRNSGNSFDAALALVSNFNFLLARFSWPQPVEDAMSAALSSVSGKPWREIAAHLTDEARAVVEKFVDDAEDEDEDEDESDDEDGESDGGEENE
jgi:hypothetical protein